MQVWDREGVSLCTGIKRLLDHEIKGYVNAIIMSNLHNISDFIVLLPSFYNIYLCNGSF